MPVFGKGRTERKIPARIKIGWKIARDKNGKRIFEPRTDWPFRDSQLAHVSKTLKFPIGKWINTRFQQTKEPVVVLDWGCATGKTITELAMKNPNASCYGYSLEAYHEWLKNKNVKFIQEEKEKLPRYFKDNSIDLIYSHVGLSHLSANGIIHQISALAKKLKKGGIFITDINKGKSMDVWKAFSSDPFPKALISPTFSGKYEVKTIFSEELGIKLQFSSLGTRLKVIKM